MGLLGITKDHQICTGEETRKSAITLGNQWAQLEYTLPDGEYQAQNTL
jgi:hypothetical protein